jgi:uncharacterized protein
MDRKALENRSMKSIIEKYHLTPHPEGGYYRELYRSEETVRIADGRTRCAITAIHFLLGSGDVSRWHRVASDEIWHFCDGSPLELHEISPDLTDYSIHHLDPPEGAHFIVIRAGHWQAARSTGGYTLVTCVVGPGFDFDDFEMLESLPALTEKITHIHPRSADFLIHPASKQG